MWDDLGTEIVKRRLPTGGLWQDKIQTCGNKVVRSTFSHAHAYSNNNNNKVDKKNTIFHKFINYLNHLNKVTNVAVKNVGFVFIIKNK